MANEAPRLSTADLRRRLLTPGNPAPVVDPGSAPPRAQGPRTAEVPLAEDAGESLDPQTPELTAVAPIRLQPTEFVRPGGRSSHFHPRPVVTPPTDPNAARMPFQT